MEKTLAFFQGKEPNGLLTEWVMYEYRLETIMKLKVTLFRLSNGLPGPAAAVEESNQRIGQYQTHLLLLENFKP
ncbi:NAC domain-containing protein [Trifolium repens]|nr:NAC domain-containing protein [Trifolium repens]